MLLLSLEHCLAKKGHAFSPLFSHYSCLHLFARMMEAGAGFNYVVKACGELSDG